MVTDRICSKAVVSTLDTHGMYSTSVATKFRPHKLEGGVRNGLVISFPMDYEYADLGLE